MKFIKKICKALIDESVKGAFARTVLITIIAIIIGFVLENNKLLDGDFLSDFMEKQFAKHAKGEKNFPYALYYILLYSFIILYSGFALYFIVKKDDVYWCALVIGISIIFLVFMNSYLTIMLQYTTDERPENTNQIMYEMHMTSFISVATMISAIAGIKMTYILGKNKKSQEEGK